MPDSMAPSAIPKGVRNRVQSRKKYDFGQKCQDLTRFQMCYCCNWALIDGFQDDVIEVVKSLIVQSRLR